MTRSDTEKYKESLLAALALLAICHVAFGDRGVRVTITQPAYGSVTASRTVAVRASVEGCTLGVDCLVRYSIKFSSDRPTDAGVWGEGGFKMQDVSSPGTHTIRAFAVDAATGTVPLGRGAASAADSRRGVYEGEGVTGGVESWLPDDMVVFDMVGTAGPLTPYASPAPWLRNASAMRPRVPSMVADVDGTAAPAVCFVGSTAFDGQKLIWLQQLDRFRQLGIPARYISFDATEGAVLNIARERGLEIEVTELRIPADALSPHQVGNINAILSELADAGGTSGDSDAVNGPPWAAAAWQSITAALAGCDVVVFGNTRDFASDKIVEIGARRAGAVAVVLDMPNYFPGVTSVDMIVAPSFHTAHHATVCLYHEATTQSKPVRDADLAMEVSPQATAHIHALHTVVPVSVISPGIDLSRFSLGHDAAEVRERRQDWSGATRVVGIVSRLSPEKCIGLALHAIAAIASRWPAGSLLVMIVGGGEELATYRDMAGRLGVPVYFTGPVFGDLSWYYSQMDILVNFMQRATFDIVNTEAMAMELPVVAFANGGQADYLVDGVNGLHIRYSGNATRVGDAIDALLRDPERRAQMGRAGRRLVERQFHAESMTSAYADMYHCLAACKQQDQTHRCGHCAVR